MPPDEPSGPKTSRQIDDAWIRGHYPRIHRAAWLMTGDAWEAEDLAQETFVVALDRWKSFEGRSSDATWLYGILIRLHQRRSRSLARMRRRLLQYVQRSDAVERTMSQTEDPQTVLARSQWQASVWADVARLPAAQQIAVTLRFAEGMPYAQIAEATGCAIGTAKTRVHHGLKRLRQQLDVERSAAKFDSGDVEAGCATATATSIRQIKDESELPSAVEITSRP